MKFLWCDSNIMPRMWRVRPEKEVKTYYKLESDAWWMIITIWAICWEMLCLAYIFVKDREGIAKPFAVVW